MSVPAVSGRRSWGIDDVRALGLTCDITTAAHVLGIGRTLAFELLREGNFPVRVLRLGRAVRVPVADLLALLGGTTDPPAVSHPRQAPSLGRDRDRDAGS